MSADNRMIVQKIGYKWHTWMQMGDMNQEPGGYFHREFDTRDEAIDYASDVCQ